MDVWSFVFSLDDWWCLTVGIHNIDTILKFFYFLFDNWGRGF
jgi:hypothetical protein